jgi:hypothetical protein
MQESPFQATSVQESPFQATSVLAMYLEPIRNSYENTYETIVTLNAMPTGPLSNLVIRLNTPQLSEFQSPGSRCVYALTRYPVSAGIKRGNAYMYADDIPSIYGYLEQHGYRIRNDWMQYPASTVTTGQQPRKLICFFQ